MSFNLLKFKKPQVDEVINQELEVDFLIIGFDAKTLFDVAISENAEQRKVLFLDQNERSIQENLKLLDNLPYPWLFNTEVNDDFKFYKDGDFRSFQGRHKINNCHPYLLKFINKLHGASWSSWWDDKLNDETKKIWNNSLLIGQVKSLIFKNNSWEVHTFDHKILKAPKIKWNLSPELFLKLFKYEEQYPKRFLTWCSHFKPLNFLLLQFNLPKEQLDKLTHGLIPMTMGTDEGYFLLSKLEVDAQGGNINLLCVFDQADLQEEDVANKIRLMKKQMNKILGVNEKILKDERVFFLPHFTFSNEGNAENVIDFIQNSAIFDFDQQYFTKTSSEVSETYLKLANVLELSLPLKQLSSSEDQLTL